MTGSEAAKAKFMSYRNVLKKTLKAAERKYYIKAFAENVSNIKNTWKIINSMLARPCKAHGVLTLHGPDGLVLDNCQAAKFNDFFCQHQ